MHQFQRCLSLEKDLQKSQDLKLIPNCIRITWFPSSCYNGIGSIHLFWMTLSAKIWFIGLNAEVASVGIWVKVSKWSRFWGLNGFKLRNLGGDFVFNQKWKKIVKNFETLICRSFFTVPDELVDDLKGFGKQRTNLLLRKGNSVRNNYMRKDLYWKFLNWKDHS